MSEITVRHGDSREVLKGLADASIDACVCDPPYALTFMGKQWDVGDTAFDPMFWAEVLRVLKPGAHVIAFSGTRTYHRLASAIEDAGFEIRDQLGWVFGSGFPKSHDVSKGIDRAAGAEREVTGQKITGNAKQRTSASGEFADGHHGGQQVVPITAPATDLARQWQGWGTALKPAWESIVLARKPLSGTVAANVLQHGTGAINIDGCRVEGAKPDTTRGAGGQNGAYSPLGAQGRILDDGRGRWPANIIHDGSDEVVAAFPDSDGAQGRVTGREPSTDDRYILSGLAGRHEPREPRGDSGSAARFFYSAKADSEDRLGSKHPTVKPIDLMAWLCRLVTPPGGKILDPFAGTGTTGLAAMREGFDCILIEREAEYVADIERRLAWARGEGRVTALEKARTMDVDKAAGAGLPLFGGDAA